MKLLKKEVTRREFLKYAFFGTISFWLLKSLSGIKKEENNGYGSRAYGE